MAYFMNQSFRRNKMDRKKTVKCIVDLYWDYDRLSSSGQETLDKLAKLYGVPTEEEVKGEVND